MAMSVIAATAQKHGRRSHSTMRYLQEVYEVIRELEGLADFRFHVISDLAPPVSMKSLRYFSWNRDTEVKDLLEFDIGLMPLPDDPWAKGKCGFKALQYLSLGIPALVSPVGVNTRIVTHGVNGFHCATTDAWKSSILKLVTDRELLSRMRKECRQVVEKGYSVKSNKERFMALFS